MQSSERIGVKNEQMERISLVGGVGVHALPHVGVFVVHVCLRQNQKLTLSMSFNSFWNKLMFLMTVERLGVAEKADASEGVLGIYFWARAFAR